MIKTKRFTGNTLDHDTFADILRKVNDFISINCISKVNIIEYRTEIEEGVDNKKQFPRYYDKYKITLSYWDDNE